MSGILADLAGSSGGIPTYTFTSNYDWGDFNLATVFDALTVANSNKFIINIPAGITVSGGGGSGVLSAFNFSYTEGKTITINNAGVIAAGKGQVINQYLRGTLGSYNNYQYGPFNCWGAMANPNGGYGGCSGNGYYMIADSGRAYAICGNKEVYAAMSWSWTDNSSMPSMPASGCTGIWGWTLVQVTGGEVVSDIITGNNTVNVGGARYNGSTSANNYYESNESARCDCDCCDYTSG